MNRLATLLAAAVMAFGLAGTALAAPCPTAKSGDCPAAAHPTAKPPHLTLKQWRQIELQRLRALQLGNAAGREQMDLQRQKLQQGETDRAAVARAQQLTAQDKLNADAARRVQACLGACASPMACLPVPGTTPAGIAPQTFCDSNRAQCQAGCR